MLGGETQFRALVTGVSGQDGWYLAQRLLADRCEVHGVVRDAGAVAALEAELPGLVTHVADLVDDAALRGAVDAAEPDRIFNLAGSTSVARSWEEPVLAADVIGIGAVRLLNAAWDRQERSGREVRFLQASSAEVFGDPVSAPQDEDTAHAPVTPYGAAKDFAHAMVQVYRRRGMFASAAILYNHESPRRPASFVARKITRAVAAIARGSQDKLVLGNIDVLRDWGYAPDHVDGMLRILAAERAGDYVVATGEARSVRDFVAAAFAAVGVSDWEPHVEIDPGLYRPADPRALVGEAARLRSLGWRPEVGFEELVSIMVRADLDELDRAAPENDRR
ncbi:MAG: GDP-mannose 4,6-dehydratase [Nocardioidaceae bacterium]